MSEIFSNVIATKELESYIEAQAQMRIVPAGDLWQRVRAMLYGEKRTALRLPWGLLHGKFDIRRGELTVWTGFKGHGKTSVLSHAMVGLMLAGERALIISPEFKSEDIVIRKIRQLAGSIDPAEEFASRAIRMLNGRLWLLDHQGLTPWRLVLGACRYAYERHGVSQVVIDSLMKCGISPDDFDAQKQFVDRLQAFAHDTGCHVHLVAHARKGQDDVKLPGLHDIKGTSELGDMAENVIAVWQNKRKAKEHGSGEDRHAGEADAKVIVESQRNHSWIGVVGLDFHPSGQFIPVGSNRPYDYEL